HLGHGWRAAGRTARPPQRGAWSRRLAWSEVNWSMLIAMSHAPNPYAPPKNDDAPPVVSAEVAAHEAIRREHINAETNVKTIGSLMYLGALGCLLNAVPTLTTEPLIAVTVLAVGVALG